MVMLAAHDLTSAGSSEFSEWELSVAAWKRDEARFGMRGFEKDHPDHKRVMKEIMGKAPANPVQRGLLERTRKNHYRLTALGRAEASRLTHMSQPPGEHLRSASDLYDAIARFSDHRVFRAWLRDPAEPRSWLGAAAFLRIAKHDPAELNSRVREALHCADEGLAWCREHQRPQLMRGPIGGGKAITLTELEKLREFIGVLQGRFELQMSAIRRRPDGGAH